MLITRRFCGDVEGCFSCKKKESREKDRPQKRTGF